MLPLQATGLVAELVDHPELAAVVAVVMRLGLAYQRGLTWYEYRTLHGVRRMLFPWLNKALPFYQRFVSEKGGRNDREFINTFATRPRKVVSILRNGGGSLHLLSSIKIRQLPDSGTGDPVTFAHLVWTHDDGTQTEAYLFANGDGGTDVYAHHETSVKDPDGHLTDKQTDGDPRGVVKAALGVE